MKNHIDTTGNITSEITSGITSLRKSHSLTGMAELFPEVSRFKLISEYKLQTNFYKLKLKTKMKNLIKAIMAVIILTVITMLNFAPQSDSNVAAAQNEISKNESAGYRMSKILPRMDPRF